MNEKLPIVNTISFSSLSDFQYCPKYFELVDVKRLKPWKNTPDTVYGQYIHKAVQNILLKKISSEEALKDFLRKWKKFCGIYKLTDYAKYSESATKTIQNVETFFQKAFGNFKVLKVEQKISMPSGQEWPQRFKGFIDLVLELEDNKIVIVDLKTADSLYMFERYKDKFKDYQLSLYKHFYCLEKKVNPKTVETYFIILEKNPKTKNPISALRVTSGKKKIENSIHWLNFALSAINRQIFIKNFVSCLKYGENYPCAFLYSPHCRNKPTNKSL